MYDGERKNVIGQVDFSEYESKPAFNFLGLTTPFDIACITTDIALWNGEKGVDIHHVMNCVEKTHAWLGRTMRATYAEPKKEGEWVDLERILQKDRE